ncbi:benenodin family lasso peptide [Novosphingobium sp.]
MTHENRSLEELIELGAASAVTQGGGPMPLDEVLGGNPAGLTDD